jgi:hypothetical protein
MTILPVYSKFVVKNISTHDVHLFGAKIKPNKTVELFSTCGGLTESKVIEGLCAPNGEIYHNLSHGFIVIMEAELTTFLNDPQTLLTPVVSMPSGGSYDIAASSGSLYLCDASTGSISVTLPEASQCSGKSFYIKKTDTSLNVVTVVCPIGSTVDGEPVYILPAPNDSCNIISSGVGFFVV